MQLLAALMMLAAGVLMVFHTRERKEHEPRMWMAVMLLAVGFYLLYAAIRTMT